MPNEGRGLPLRIGIDYTAAARETAGIGRYARELINAVLKLDTRNSYVLMTGSAGLGAAWTRQKAKLLQLSSPEHLTIRSLPLTDDWLARIWQRLRVPFPAELITGRVDLFYSPNFILPPLLPKTPSLLTIHDLSFMRYPETFPEKLRAYLENAVPRSVNRATHIVADSEATRQDLISLLGVAPEKITPLLLGVSSRFKPLEEEHERQQLRNRYGIAERPYILALGTVQPRKNYVRLMQALDPIAEKLNVDLVIAGRPAWLSEAILEEAANRSFVKMLGFTDDADLPALYRQSAVFAFPSLYEGFGLPPLEAMACGTPVIASSASSVPEAVGQAGLLIDPLDMQAWTTAIEQVLEDSDLRIRLISSGLAHSNQFTWERAAKQWLALLPNIVS